MKKEQQNTPTNFVDEVILTFSNRKSLLSSKKIERFIIFNVVLVLTVFYVWTNIEKLSPRDFIEIILVWLGYGGYNSFMNFKDKKMDRLQDSSTTTT